MKLLLQYGEDPNFFIESTGISSDDAVSMIVMVSVKKYSRATHGICN
ncbi:hypothetical protein Ct9H90mP29_08690 [bacterium]|nr:MAG: hypothetical protein Ct9H90mP29_08690 [bacterium]